MSDRLKPYVLLDDGGSRLGYGADWLDSRHHYRRLASEFIGTFGFVFALSAGAGAFHAYAKPQMSGGMTVTLLTMVAALWLVIAIYALGDVSAHFNPAVTFAFALRGDMSWKRAGLYWAVQASAAGTAALLARAFFQAESGLAAVHTPAGKQWPAVAFESVLTALFVFMVLAMARGPKLNGPFTPIAVGAYVLSLGTVGGLYEGASFNPARAFGPDLATGDFHDLWVYVLGAGIGAPLAVLLDRYLRGAADVEEASIAESGPT